MSRTETKKGGEIGDEKFKLIDSCINFNEDNSQEWFGHFVIAFRVEEEFSEVAYLICIFLVKHKKVYEI